MPAARVTKKEEKERIVTQAFLESLLADVKSDKERKEREYLMLNIVPTVVPGTHKRIL